MKRKNLTIILCLTLGLIGYTIRVLYVNIYTPKVETVTYEIGQWIDLSDTFLDSKRSEQREGYSVNVKRAELLSYNEFVSRYGHEKDQIAGLDEKNVVDVELEIKNVGNEDGYISTLLCNMISESKNYYLNRDIILFNMSQPGINDFGIISIRSDSEYTTHIPYTLNTGDDMVRFEKPLSDKHFEFVFSNAPIRQVVNIQLD